jgi:hypothetical protein
MPATASNLLAGRTGLGRYVDKPHTMLWHTGVSLLGSTPLTTSHASPARHGIGGEAVGASHFSHRMCCIIERLDTIECCWTMDAVSVQGAG